jgi:hypothetical protein
MSSASSSEGLGPPPRDPIFEAVRDILVECVCCEPAEVIPRARFHDLCPDDSVEWLDFQFRVEKRFKIDRPFNRVLNNKALQYDRDWRLSPSASEWLATELVAMGIPRPDPDKLRTVQDVLTVEFLVAAIRHEIAEQDRNAANRA